MVETGRYRIKPRVISAAVIPEGDPLTNFEGVVPGDYVIFDGDKMTVWGAETLKKMCMPINEDGDDIPWEEEEIDTIRSAKGD